jgi:hypothetical protein
MPKPEPLFYDSEFTGLHQAATLISIGLSSASGAEFYAEFSDYDRSQCDQWIQDHVLARTRWLRQGQTGPLRLQEGGLTLCLGQRAEIAEWLAQWLQQFPAVEIWADCLAWDWVLFCQLFGGALHIPRQVFYLPYDLATLFHSLGLPADTPRAEFAGLPPGDANAQSHNALWDARVIKACQQKLAARMAPSSIKEASE